MKQTQRHENKQKSLLRTAALTALTAAVCTALLPLCGCLNPVSLDNYGYVVTVGADIGQKREIRGDSRAPEGKFKCLR